MDLSNENVIHVKKNGVEYLQFKKLLEYKDMINHAYTLGVDADYRTYTVDKTPLTENNFTKNINCYKNVCEAIGGNYNDIVQTVQLHTNNVITIDEKVNRDKYDVFEKKYYGIDGFVTNKTNIMLSTTNADCILLLFFDPVKKVISNVHSGWKGTLQEISVQAVNKMINEFECNPSDIICCICPSIRKCHFEVDEDVKNLFWEKFKNLKEINDIIECVPKQTKYNAEKSTISDEQKGKCNIDTISDEQKSKWNIDTVLINKVILKNAGLKDENIIDCGICSVCNSNLIHSFRVEKVGYGLETALIELK